MNGWIGLLRRFLKQGQTETAKCHTLRDSQPFTRAGIFLPAAYQEASKTTHLKQESSNKKKKVDLKLPYHC